MDQSQIQQITDRISQKLESKGVSPDRQSIADKLASYINEFGVVAYEAERKVLSDQMRQYDILEDYSSYAPVPASEGCVYSLADIQPGEWVTVEVKVVSLKTPVSPLIAQTGVLADSSGAVRFVVFAKASELPPLELEHWYRIESAVVDLFRDVPSLKIHSGSQVTPLADDRSLMLAPPMHLSDLTPGVVASIQVKFVEEWEVRSDRMMQTGLVGDETGLIKFVLWKDEKKEKLVPGQVYLIKNAKVDEYNGRLYLALNNSVYEVDELEADIAVRTIMDEYAGTIVQIYSGSGLVKRYPMDGCNRVLSRQNFCPIHEVQNDFHYDLRINAVLDNGHKAYNVLIGREVTEQITGMTMDQAIDLASESPLGLEEVHAQFTEKLCGRYLRCFGNEFEGMVLVKSAEFIRLDPSVTAELMNRAGAFTGGEEQ